MAIFVEGFRFIYENYIAYFSLRLYANRRIAIKIPSLNEGPLAILTVNLPDEKLEDGELHIKTWSENALIAEAALKTGLFVDTGKRVKTGFREASVWKLADKVEFRP